MPDRLEGRNPILECLLRRRREVHQIWLDERARPDRKLEQILGLASKARVPVRGVRRQKLDEMTEGRVHNGIVASVSHLPDVTTLGRIDALFDEGASPFFLLADEVNYEHNLGAMLRTALGFGVHALVLPTRRGASVSPVVSRVSMGAVEVVPVIREGLSGSLKHLKKAGVKVVGADMGGTPMSELDLRGPVAIVMGGESKGLSPALRKKCDAVASVPLAGGLESLNVSVAAALLMYEKRRQDGWFSPDRPE